MRTAIITGGSGGLGLESARRLAKANGDWMIVLASRNRERTEQAAESLIRDCAYPHVQAMRLDLASMKTIRDFVAEVKTRNLPQIQAFVCNAGVQYVQGTEYTEDGFEATFGTNHLGHYLLVRLMLPLLDASARIVVVSSDTHDPAKKTGMPAPQYFHPEQMADPDQSDAALAGLKASTRGQIRYTTSKHCNLYFVYGLECRLRQLRRDNPDLRIAVNAFNPGMMPGTGLARSYGRLARLAWHYALPLLRYIRPSVRSVEESGQALARLLIDESLAGTSGLYFDGYEAIASSLESYRQDRIEELWQWSERLTGLTGADDPASYIS
ncbi:SDR family NAD(P)-dependent oxidoreductase [Paenibacillus thailandensis]|uniref:SDR family NAD(P)-dependent oxidoreductase n=1 Tax=Paenibacillus thailandensis TaxID=393250 RepID=A0ABW5QUJ4_9BACL